jgi:hypothetical protein
MKKRRERYTPEEKVAILRRHLARFNTGGNILGGVASLLGAK